ncbi:MAG TPA: hypothetical protein VG410_03050 [Solirubrobacteraceae bacterium]|nr:hypothetical protein [Solirubrobacteraceae bacterium]
MCQWWIVRGGRDTPCGAFRPCAVHVGAVQAGAVQAGAVQAGAVQAGAVQAGAVQAGAVQAGAVDSARRLKPSIPLVDDHGIPVHDELEFSLALG